MKGSRGISFVGFIEFVGLIALLNGDVLTALHQVL